MLRVLILAVLLSGCAAKTEPETIKAINNHALLIDSIVRYLGEMQRKGVLPKAEQKAEDKK